MKVKSYGFTLIEVIIIVAVLTLVATMVFVLLDPAQRLADAEDSSREKDVAVLANALGQFAQDNRGALPFLGRPTTTKKTICTLQSGSTIDCGGESDYCIRITSSTDFFAKYLPSLPIDPDKTDLTDTGYYVQTDANDNLIVGACSSNGNAITLKPNISVSCDAYAGGYCWVLTGTAGYSCDTICSNVGKTCVENVTYGPDLNSSGTGYCDLQKALIGDSGACSTICGDFGTYAPMYSGANCHYQGDGVVPCDVTIGGWYAACPCQ